MPFEIPSAIKTWSQFGHPIFMWVLFGLSIYAFYLGKQIRRTRKADKEERKELIKQNFATKHHKVGSLILAVMILGTVGGMAVTYINNEKLFLSPHLLVGLGMISAIAVSTSLVPYMQKGDDLARVTHISINMILLLLFGWQAFTGMQIMFSIIERM